MSQLAGQIVPIVVALVMLSMGLSLTPADFSRALKVPKALGIALLCQWLLIPVIGFVIVWAFKLPPVLAVGMMLLAASPGGTTASVFSHVANGDLALNITLTAINSVVSLITLPLILWLALLAFQGDTQFIVPQPAKVIGGVAFVLIPVALGMMLRWRAPRFADRSTKPVKILAALFLAMIATLVIVTSWTTLVAYFPVLGAVALIFSLISISLGYGLPRLIHLDRRQSIAISMEVGLHNSALAIGIAMSPLMLNDPTMAISPTLYGLLSLIPAAGFAWWVNRKPSMVS